MAEVSDVFLRHGFALGELPIVKVYLARERARLGDLDEAIRLMLTAVDHLFREGQLPGWAFQRKVFSRRHCSIAALTPTWLKPKPRSPG
jgi:hypothetical protein